MKVTDVSKINFEGKIVILNDLSHKPDLSIKKVKVSLQKLIEPMNCNLFVEQNYTNNKINIGVSQLNPKTMSGVISHEELPITAKSSRYVYAAKNAIDKYKKAIMDIEMKDWEQKRKNEKFQDLKDIACSFLMFPLFVINYILHSINPKWSKSFEKLLEIQ